ncbi:apolipoprotein N-acyltransferase, partial [Campylobacter coli]|nr:apolipoprotein N-acyltransferase [Campylobacter coli]ECP7532488.1 apolipoprotein N-acyltransferase [Campylobacter coli]EEP3468165.1 apolipoprotein N-acyltransferase [Campylobacter coli]EHG5194542.1 apolipoprotein N-acyltransferase [Campylobacter coli]
NYSSEYKLQKLLMQFYASKYGVSVYHATNGKESGVIKPKEKFVQKIKNYFNKQDKS